MSGNVLKKYSSTKKSGRKGRKRNKDHHFVFHIFPALSSLFWAFYIGENVTLSRSMRRRGKIKFMEILTYFGNLKEFFIFKVFFSFFTKL
jgi:hypothetical protein